MALVDALLLDPARYNLFVAWRGDLIAGSGTAEDPYNGSPRQGPAISTTLVRGTTPPYDFEAMANTGPSKGSDLGIVTFIFWLSLSAWFCLPNTKGAIGGS